MSFILDALKKSEAERQQKNTPGIASIAESGQTRSASKWIWIIGVLLVANLAALAYIMLKPGPPGSPTSQEQAGTTGPPETPAQAAEFPETPAEDTGSIQAHVERPSAGPPEPVPRSRAPEPADSAAEAPAQQVSTPAPEPSPTVTDGLASFKELRSRGVLQLSDLHLDIHVYSGVPAERFVFINMAKYTENSVLAEGPTVREITPDGVVLDYLGTPFLLPRE